MVYVTTSKTYKYFINIHFFYFIYKKTTLKHVKKKNN